MDRQRNHLVLHSAPMRNDYTATVTVAVGDPLPLPKPFGFDLDTSQLH